MGHHDKSKHDKSKHDKSKHDKSKHDKSKHDKSKRHGRSKPSGDKRVILLHGMIAELQNKRQSLVGQQEEYDRLRGKAEDLQDRLESSQQSLELLSSSSLSAQQARGKAQLSSHPDQRIIAQGSRKEHLKREVRELSRSIAEYDRRSNTMEQLISLNAQEIEELEARIRQIEAEAEAEAEAMGSWYEEQGGPGPDWWEGPGSGGGTSGGGSYGYYEDGSGQASYSVAYSQY